MSEYRTIQCETHKWNGKINWKIENTDLFKCDDYFEDDEFVGLEQTELSVHLERIEWRIEDICSERGQHTTEEYHPAELHAPEWRHLFHGEQQATNGCTECCSYASRSSRSREISPKTQRNYIRYR